MNNDQIDDEIRGLGLLDMISLEFILEMILSLVLFLCIFVCWRALSKNPKLDKLGRGFGFLYSQ